MSRIIIYFTAMRVKHYIKNLFVFIPLFFSQNLFSAQKFIIAFVVFTAFCFASSACYLLNDIHDAERDRLHPLKKFRPIASGGLCTANAYIFAVMLLSVSIGLIYIFLPKIETAVLSYIAAYIGINVLYTIRLKNVPLVDCFCIAAGFLLRLYAGGAAVYVEVSDWLLLTSLSLSLFMAFGKRRGELIKLPDGQTRPVLKKYNFGFLNGAMFMSAGLFVVFYSMWALGRNRSMIYTTPLVLLITFRYVLNVYGDDSSGDPTNIIFEDKLLMCAGAVYTLAVMFCLYI